MYSFTTMLMVARQLAPLEQLAQATDDPEDVKVDEVEIEVEVCYSPGIYAPASFSGHPDNWHPDESEPPEIESVTTETGQDISEQLTEEQVKQLEQRAWDDQAEAAANAHGY